MVAYVLVKHLETQVAYGLVKIVDAYVRATNNAMLGQQNPVTPY